MFKPHLTKGKLISNHVDCNAACQKKDWKFHKFECRASQARKAFYRAGQTVQLAYYGLVEQLFDMSAVKVKAQGNILYVYEGTDNGKLNSTLPNQDFGNEDKHAILSWMDSGSSEKYFQVLVNAMLQGQKPSLFTSINRSK